MTDPNEQTAIDMAAARAATSFDPDRIYRMLNEGSRDADMRRKVADALSREPVFSKAKRSVSRDLLSVVQMPTWV